MSKPVTIEAIDREAARSTLSQVLHTLPAYKMEDLIGETTSSLVTGISTIIKRGQKYIWNGRQWVAAKVPQKGPRRFQLVNGKWKEIK